MFNKRKALLIPIAALMLLLAMPVSSLSDATGPAQEVTLELVGQIGGATRAVHVMGNYAYIGVGPRLVILDVSNPANPHEVGRTDLLPDVVRDLHVIHNYVYVIARGLRIISVADKANPREAGFLAPGWTAYDVQVVGDYAYIVDDNVLRIISVADKANPREVGSFDVPGGVEYIPIVKDLYVAGNYAYVVVLNWYRSGRQAGRLWIISVADKANPRAVGFLDIPETEGAYGVHVVGDYAYVGTGPDGLWVISVADKANPHEVGFLSVRAGDVHVAGHYAYLVNG